jgi:hypothetical protein
MNVNKSSYTCFIIINFILSNYKYTFNSSKSLAGVKQSFLDVFSSRSLLRIRALKIPRFFRSNLYYQKANDFYFMNNGIANTNNKIITNNNRHLPILISIGLNI